jgi:hypothetical protein
MRPFVLVLYLNGEHARGRSKEISPHPNLNLWFVQLLLTYVILEFSLFHHTVRQQSESEDTNIKSLHARTKGSGQTF